MGSRAVAVGALVASADRAATKVVEASKVVEAAKVDSAMGVARVAEATEELTAADAVVARAEEVGGARAAAMGEAWVVPLEGVSAALAVAASEAASAGAAAAGLEAAARAVAAMAAAEREAKDRTIQSNPEGQWFLARQGR